MKSIIQSIIVVVSLPLFFSGCEVGITALEQAGNEVSIVTTDAINEDGDVVSRIEIPKSAGDVDVSVEIYGEDSKYFTVELTENLGRYDSLITEKPNNSPFYQNTTFHFFTRFILNGQNQCIGNVTKTIIRTEVAPVARDQNVTMDEGTSILIELDASDKNEDRLNYIVKESPSYGTLSINEGNFTFTPEPNYFGLDSFTYIVDDNNLSSNIATVNIIINDVIDIIPDNIKPTITLNGTDVNLTVGDTYIDSGATATDNVDGNLTANIIVNNPIDTTIAGTYTVSYDVNDTAGNPADQVVRTVRVTAAIPNNNAPVAYNINIEMNGSTTIDFNLTANDEDGDDLNYTIISSPVNGSLSYFDARTGKITYITDGYIGNTSFTYSVNDGESDSNIATVNIVINAAIDNIKPIITLNDTDVNLTVGDIYTDAGATATDNVDGNLTANIIVNNPVDTSVAGTYTVSYNVNDSAGNSALQVTRTVTVIDTTPPAITLIGQNPQTIEAGTLYTEQNASSDDGSTVIIDSTAVNTTQVGDYNVTYNATDDNGNVADEVIRTVRVVDTTKPVITLVGGDVILVVGDSYSDAGATANDTIEGDVTSNIVTGGDTVDTAIPGDYIITYDVNDSAGNMATQKIRIVTVINNAPVATSAIYTMDEDSNLTLILLGSDDDSGAVLTYSIVADPSNGSININGDTVTYTPDPDYFGTDSFTFVVRDEFNATSNVANIDINISDVAEPNTTPIVQDINISMDSNITLITFDLNASDVDIGDTLTYSIVVSPAFGTLMVDNNQSGQVSYNRGTYTGNASFTYKVNDGTIDSNIATVTIESNVINSPPIAYNKSINLDESGAPSFVLDANDTDIADTLSYRIGVSPSYGTVSLVGNQVTYTPNVNYTGNDSFTFIANDGTDDSNEALVYMEVGTTQLESRLFNWCKNDDEELWRTDGTLSGTVRVKDIRSGGSAIPQSFVKIKNTYFFMANDGIHGQELWKSQGTKGSTVLVKDIKTKGKSHASPHKLIDINGTLFFAAKDGTNGIELWKSDGTTLGTKLVKDINKNGHSKPENMTNVNGTLYFTAGDGENGRELWRSDGTVEGTHQVNDINSKGSSNPQYLTNINGVLYFSADDGGATLPNPLGRELWYYNTNISDIASGFTNRGYFDIFGGSTSSNPEELFNYNGTLVFSAETKIYGRELWISDGTTGGMKMHSNYAGDNTIFGDFRDRSSSPHSFVVVNNTLYFSAYQILNGYNLRKIDSIDDTIIDNVIYEFNGEGYLVSNPENLIQSNNALFFSTYNKNEDQNGNTTDEWVYFWKVIGDKAQRETLFHPTDSIRDMVNINDILYFVVTEKNDVDEFWRYDGNLELLTTGCSQ